MIVANNRALPRSPTSRSIRNSKKNPHSAMGAPCSLLIPGKRSGSPHHGHGNVPWRMNPFGTSRLQTGHLGFRIPQPLAGIPAMFKNHQVYDASKLFQLPSIPAQEVPRVAPPPSPELEKERKFSWTSFRKKKTLNSKREPTRFRPYPAEGVCTGRVHPTGFVRPRSGEKRATRQS